MATHEELGLALQKAHEAGDTEGAKVLAQAYAGMPEEAPKELPAGNRFLNGVGGEVLKAGLGVADMLPENSAHEWLSKVSKQGLDKATGTAGEVGKFVGASAPYVALPGGGVIKTALLGAALSGATTEGNPEERAKQALTTGAISALTGGALNVAGMAKKPLEDMLSNSIANANKFNALNAPKAAALQAGKEAGYVIPPSDVNPSWFNKRLESIAGKAAIGQQAAVENQPITTALARKELGMAEDAPISVAALNGLRKEASAPYQEIADLPTPLSLANGYSGPHHITNAVIASDLLTPGDGIFSPSRRYLGNAC